MEKNNTWKWIALVMMLLWSVILTMGGINRGLDIVGGLSMDLEIDEAKFRTEYAEANPGKPQDELEGEFARALEGARNNLPEIIRNRIDKTGVVEPAIYSRGGNRLVVQIPAVDEKQQEEARKAMKAVAALQFKLIHENSDEWVKELIEKNLAPPGFKYVKLDERTTALIREGKADINWDVIKKFQPRSRSEFMLEKKVLRDGSTAYFPAYVETRTMLDGTELAKAFPNIDANGRTIISFVLKKTGAKKFARITSDYCPRGQLNNSEEGRQLAIILDGTLYSSPVIRSPILGGEGMIEGSFDYPEALRLSTVLMSGALPAPVNILSENTVSATAGASAVSSGITAAIVGSIGVFLFMAFYYRLAGIVQNLALLLVIVLMPFGAWVAAGFLGLISSGGTGGGKVMLPTLTLPGIAGIALTVGMAVDAAVLIFERMREELSSGKPLRAAIAAGYERAFSAILDSNVTTIITAVILYWQGTGPIRGFAVMLTAGIIVSMLVYLIYMKLFLNSTASSASVKTFKFLHVINATNFDFLGKTKIAVILTILILAGAVAGVAMRGKKVFNVEFLGGAEVTFTGLTADTASIQKIDDTLKAAGIADSIAQYEGGKLVVRVGYDEKATAHEHDKAKAAITAAFPAAQTTGDANLIGAQVGDELATSGIYALIFAIAAILIYLTLRFEFAYAVGAIVALIHDAVLTVTMYGALGHQYSLAFISALLAMLGYSTNDTIIVFDRIREEVKLQGNRMSYRQICNRAINLTLSRSIITHLTTLISVTALWLLGTGVIKDIAFTLFVGIVTATFSSIFIATPVMLLWHRQKDARDQQRKAAAEAPAAKPAKA